MTSVTEPWDYLIVTAANDEQAAAYETQLALRQTLGLLAGVRQVLVLADPGGQRIGSGGSTIYCMMQVLNREMATAGGDLRTPEQWREILADLRILIVHAGGDSKRLPAYGPCGKIFVPVPGESDSALATTLFDRQIRTYLDLPPSPPGAGQIVVTAGDVLLSFDPTEVRFEATGVTGLGCLATPEQASRHGVYCADEDGQVRLFLQKCSPADQAAKGAVDRYGHAILDIGVMNIDAASAVTMLQTFDVHAAETGELAWAGEMHQAITDCGLDFYREICCAMGSQATSAHHIAAVKAGGSRWDDASLGRMFQGLREIPFSVQLLPQCGFLHFGTTRQIVNSGLELLMIDRGVSQLQICLSINNDAGDDEQITGTAAWVEGCRIASSLTLGGQNVVVGVDVESPLSLPPGACLDVVPGRNRDGEPVSFVRCHGVDDAFKDTVADGATLCSRPVNAWLDLVGVAPADVWDASIPPERRTLWDAAVFPAEPDGADYTRWLWMFAPDQASDEQKRAYLAADRYSPAQIASLTDQTAFHSRRARIRAEEIRRSLRRRFRMASGFSAADLHHVLASIEPASRAGWVSQLLTEAHWHFGANPTAANRASFAFSRILHTLGTAVSRLAANDDVRLADVLPGLTDAVPPAERAWLAEIGLDVDADTSAVQWAQRARAAVFDQIGRTIIATGARPVEPPTNALRSDEIVWGRAPARLDLAGGWSDTPPYSLEHGGCVINAAVDLNGQPPIHCYGRTIAEPLIRIGSIDLGTRIEITSLDDLLDFRSATNEFSLAKAALALSAFSPSAADWAGCDTLEGMLARFGGGIELTTLAAIPKGSGLGTSSITGAVILAVVQRLIGRVLGRRDLFHGVLRLEQALTTGGGWQDQVGGAVDGVKVITAEAGLVPDPRIHYVPADVVDPAVNGGVTLLYYTGITRLARDILHQVVGRYLDRDRVAMATSRQIHDLPPYVADAMARKDLAAFGGWIDAAWRLNKQLDPNSSNDAVEALLARVRPHVHGAKLLGAGGGGFLLMVCRSAQDATAVRSLLERDPPNERARFFDFSISAEGLIVTTC